ncbi:MAG: TerB family tellurite resistance protein [Blastocatellia bacterium]|nr:TerB family tellurite resistance protein [Blastocatellia bacterium]
MSVSDTFEDFKKSKEEEYFHKKEQELVAKMRERTAKETQLKALGEAVGVADEDVLTLLQDLGFSRETVSILHLVPLIQVAWADGSVTSQERNLINQLAAQRGITPDSPASVQLNQWLTVQPSKTFFETSLRIIHFVLDHTTKESEKENPSDLVGFCLRVAKASGGFLGFGHKISEEEQEVLSKISETLLNKDPDLVTSMLEKK